MNVSNINGVNTQKKLQNEDDRSLQTNEEMHSQAVNTLTAASIGGGIVKQGGARNSRQPESNAQSVEGNDSIRIAMGVGQVKNEAVPNATKIDDKREATAAANIPGDAAASPQRPT